MDQHVIDGLTVLPPLLAEYRFDPTFEIKHNLVSFEQGYSFEYHNMFKNTRDVTFNKSSNFYLTDQYGYNDIVSIKPLPREYPEVIASYLVFNRIETDPLSALSANSTCLTSNSATSALSADDQTSMYMTILDDAGETGDSTTSRKLFAELFVDAKTRDTLEQKYYFNIMFLDGYRCVVYHLIDDDRYYLSFDTDAGDPSLQFIKVPHDYGLENNIDEILSDAPGEGGDDIVFLYTYLESDNLIRLFKKHDNQTKVVRLLSTEERDLNPYGTPVVLEPLLDPDNDNDASTNAPNILELTNDTTLRLRPRATKHVNTDLNSQVFNYSNTIDQNNVNIDSTNSASSLTNNLLAHSEYYYLTGTSIPVNILPLKNQQTDSGLVLPTNQWNESAYSHRNYNKLFTGSNQIQGTDKIYMDYSSSNFDVHIKPGMNYFNFPQDADPVVKLNINDSNLAACGAICSNRPSGSDKVFKKLAGYEQYTRWGDPTNEQTGTWLCAWLSGNSDPNVEPVWMDRYYNPSSIGGTQAFTADTQYLHNKYTSDTDTVFASSSGDIIDKPSELTFEPGCAYAYYRQDDVDYTNNVSNLAASTVQQGLDNYKSINGHTKAISNNGYTFNLDNIASVDSLTTYGNLTGSFTMTFDINIDDITRPVGHQILGNYTDTGIGMFNVNDVSPFIFLPGPDGARVNGVKQDSSIRIYDNNYNLYNYVTNDSYLGAGESPALFKKVVIRELPENIYSIMTDGKILEMSHDGVIKSVYNDWVTTHGSVSGATISSVTYDEELIYILTTFNNTNTISIDTFNMSNKQMLPVDINCVVKVPIPYELQNNTNYDYGDTITYDQPPTLIYVKDDHAPYQDKRTIYVGYGDEVKSTSDTLWFLTKGSKDPITDSQQKHDMVYGYNTRKLELLEGYITDNNLKEPTSLLEVVDFLTDKNDNIWIAHNTSYLSKFDNNRNILLVKNVDDRQILTMVMSKDLSNGNIQERLVVLSKLVGDEELQMQIGPALHPTDNPDNVAYRKASPYIDNGDFVQRPTYIDPESFDDTVEIIYPFSLGTDRFGEHTNLIDDIPSTETTGRVIPGDYTLMTEGLNIIVNEAEDVMYGDVYNIQTGNVIETKILKDFPIDDINIKPQMFNHYEYSKENYNKYTDYNLNFKITLNSLFENTAPDNVNLKLDLKSLNKHHYTGVHHIALVIDNDNGRVEFWVDGNLDEQSRVYEFEPTKHTFNSILNTNLTVGATPYLKNTLLANKLNRPTSYICNNLTINNFACYSKPLNYYEQLDVIRSNSSPDPFDWTVPSSLRNYIEGIDRVFNHSIPPSKSNVYDIEIRNSAIQLQRLQQYINNKLDPVITKYSTGGTRVRNVKWSNELLLTN